MRLSCFKKKLIEQILAECNGCFNYIDDIVIFARNENELAKREARVFKALADYNVVLNEYKCIFRARELVFLGHRLFDRGIAPSIDKVEAIKSLDNLQTQRKYEIFGASILCRQIYS